MKLKKPGKWTKPSHNVLSPPTRAKEEKNLTPFLAWRNPKFIIITQNTKIKQFFLEKSYFGVSDAHVNTE